MDPKFIKDRESAIYQFATIVELFLSILIFYVSVYIREHYFVNDFIYTREYQILMLIMIFSWFFLLRTNIFEKFNRTKSYSAILIDYTKGIILGATILAVSIFIFKLETISRGFLLIFAPLNLLILFSFRLMFYQGLKHYRSQGRNQKNVVIIGDDSSENVIDKILRNKDWGLRIVKIISNSKRIHEKYHSFFPVIPEKENLHRMLELDVIDDVKY